MIPSRVTTALTATLIAFFAAGELPALEARLIGPESQCLGTSGAPATGSPLQLGVCGVDSRQRFSMPPRGFGGEIRLGSYCLDVDQSQSEDGTPIQLYPCHGGANQLWQHDTLGRLVGFAGKCLDLAGNGDGQGPAALNACATSSSQTFLGEPFEAWGLTHSQNALENAWLLPTSDPAIVYQRSFTELLRSSDGGRTFTTVSHWDGFALDVAVDPTRPNRLWRITNLREFSRSDDGGRSWRTLFLADEDLRHLSVSRRDPNVLLMLSEKEVWLSRDGGLTLERHGELPAATELERRDVADLVENGQGEWVLAELRDCLSGNGGCDGFLYITTDYGASWQKTLDFTASYVALAISPAAQQTLFSLERDGEVLRSQDGGHNFTRVGLVPGSSLASFPIDIAADPTEPSKLWAIFNRRLHASGDGGGQWLETAGSLLLGAGFEPQSVRALGGGTVLVVAVRPSDAVRQVLISRDGGATWLVETHGVQGGNLSLAAAALPGRYYGFSKDTLLRTDDRGRFWQEISPRPCARKLETDPIEPATFYASSSSCVGQWGDLPRGLWRSRNAGATFENITPPGVTFELSLLVALRHGNATVLLTGDETNSGQLWRSADGGSTWQTVTAASSTVYEILADAGKIWTAAGQVLSQSNDGGLTWVPVGGGPSYLVVGGGKRAYTDQGDIVVELPSGAVVRHPNPTNNSSLGLRLDRYGRLYLVGRSIFRSLDDGRTWQNLETGTLGQYLDFVADPFDAELLLASSPSGPMLGRFADSAVLTLGHGRFKATIDWKAPDGLFGRGNGKNLTDDSGGFWFFSPERTEVVVKVLDGRRINGRYWVFVGSLTDVEFDLELVDQVSGEKRRYHNNASSFASFGDTQAFPLGEAQPTIETEEPTFFYPSTTQAVPVGDHFEVEVSWQTADGQGAGMGSRLSGETAAFTFFSPENVELLVNVIDGRAINGRYWVFAASLSNVAYTLRVRDLQTGEIKEYQNPAGSFASFGDTSAF